MSRGTYFAECKMPLQITMFPRISILSPQPYKRRFWDKKANKRRGPGEVFIRWIPYT